MTNERNTKSTFFVFPNISSQSFPVCVLLDWSDMILG